MERQTRMLNGMYLHVFVTVPTQCIPNIPVKEQHHHVLPLLICLMWHIMGSGMVDPVTVYIMLCTSQMAQSGNIFYNDFVINFNHWNVPSYSLHEVNFLCTYICTFSIGVGNEMYQTPPNYFISHEFDNLPVDILMSFHNYKINQTIFCNIKEHILRTGEDKKPTQEIKGNMSQSSIFKLVSVFLTIFLVTNLATSAPSMAPGSGATTSLPSTSHEDEQATGTPAGN